MFINLKENMCLNLTVKKLKHTKFQVEVFWVVTPCSVVVDTSVSEVHAASIFRVEL